MNTISHKDYLALAGLVELARRHRLMLDDLEAAALAITQERDTLGHTLDILSGDRDLDNGLRLMGIEVRSASEADASVDN